MAKTPPKPKTQKVGNNPNPNAPANQAATVLNEANQAAATSQVAKTALILRQLALAAKAMGQLPNGGAAADGLRNILDTAINRGGRLYIHNGKQLKRTSPPVSKNAMVGWAWLLRIAPWAMEAIPAAVQAARVGLSRFGASALLGNLKTATAFMIERIGIILSALKNIPGMATLCSFVMKALNAAAILLGLQGVAKVVAPNTAKAVDNAAAAAVNASKDAAAKAAHAAGRAVDKVAELPGQIGTGLKWAAGIGAAVLILPHLKG